MVKHDIGELGTIVAFEAHICLTELVSLLEVLADLHGNLCKNWRLHTYI